MQLCTVQVRNKQTTYMSTRKPAGTQRPVINSPTPPYLFFFFRREAWEGSFSDKPKSNYKSAVLLDPMDTQTLLQKF